MPKKAAPKDARMRTKKPGKIADLPARSVRDRAAAAVVGGDGLANSLQNQQQNLQQLTNTSKQSFDNALALTRKIGG